MLASYHRFNQNLHHDVGMPRPQRLAHSNFVGALRHAHQHDVHDYDAAYHQRDAGDRHHDGRHQAK